MPYKVRPKKIRVRLLKQHKEGTCKVSGRSVVFSASYADFCFCPKLVIITTLIRCFLIEVVTKVLLNLQVPGPSSSEGEGLNRLNATDSGIFIYLVASLFPNDLTIQKLFISTAAGVVLRVGRKTSSRISL